MCSKKELISKVSFNGLPPAPNNIRLVFIELLQVLTQTAYESDWQFILGGAFVYLSGGRFSLPLVHTWAQCSYKVAPRDKIVLTLHPHQDPCQGDGKTQNWSDASESKDAEQFIYCDSVSSPHVLHQVTNIFKTVINSIYSINSEVKIP